MLLASCSYDEAKRYHNKLVLVSDKETKKQEEVQLNIITDNPDEVLGEKLNKVVKCVTSRFMPSSCPENLYGSVFHEVDLKDYEGVEETEGVVCLIRLPDGFCDMRRLLEISSINSNYSDVEAKVRFIGGNLLEIPSIHIGRYDSGKEKMSAVFNKVYDIFKEVSLEDIKVQEVMSKVRPTNKSKSSGGIKSASSKTKKAESFSKLFGGLSGGF